MTWDTDLTHFIVKLDEDAKAVFVNAAAAVQDSIQNGSVITGARGQPVGQYGPGYHEGEVGGTLKASWQMELIDEDHARVYTNEVYAPMNEYGVRPDGLPYRQRSTVGGRHSVALTIAGWQNIVNNEAAKLQGFADSRTGYANEDGG